MSTETKPAEAKPKKAPKEPKPMRLREGLTEQQVKDRKAELTVEEVPDGWRKLSELHKACVEAEIPISKMVRAIGGDRGMNDPADPVFRIVYKGNTRYVSPKAFTDGIALLKSPDFLKTRRARRAKKAEGEEDPTGTTGPVRDSKKGPSRPKVTVKAKS